MGRRALTLALAGLCLAPAARAADAITGVVERVIKQADGTTRPATDVEPVVVYVPDFKQDAPPGGPHPVLRQKNRAFVPEVLVVVKGQEVDFQNDDEIIHNVFSNSRAVGSKTMDLGKYKHGVRTHGFDQTGVVDVYCDIHESMSAKLLVVPNPAFALVRPDGSFALPNVPPGKHTLWAWTRHGTSSVEVEVTPGKPAQARLTVVETPVAEPHLDKYKKPYTTHAEGYGK